MHGATRAAVPAVGRAGRLHLPGWPEGRHARDHRGDRTTELTPDTTEETETTAGSTEQQVNDTVEFQDGVKMTVLGLNRNASRSSYAAGGHPGDQTVVATVKVTNGADHPIDLNVTLSLSNGADGIAAEDVFDPDSGYNGIDRPAKLHPVALPPASSPSPSSEPTRSDRCSCGDRRTGRRCCTPGLSG